MEKFDIAVIGSGPGGYVAAIKAASLGSKVALIEKKQIGGTCLNEGCIPTKTLLASSTFLQKIKKAPSLGIKIDSFSLNFSEIMQRKNRIVQTLRTSLEQLIKANKITIIKGKAAFLSDHEIEIADENRTIYAEKIIIATGSVPKKLPNIEYNENIHDSSSILNLSELPKSLAIIGGGYIGCEFADLFNALGVKVTIIEQLPSLLSSMEEEISKRLTQEFAKKNINVKTNQIIQNIEQGKEGIFIELENEEIFAEHLLIAVGREISCDLQLEKAAVLQKNDGHIPINEYCQTNVDHIYAIGDVTKKALLAHVASKQAEIAAHHIHNKKEILNENTIPSVVYTTPEIASVGLTKKQAQEQNLSIVTGSYPYQALGISHSMNQLTGFFMVHIDIHNKKILGAHILGEKASDLISEMTVAMDNNLTIDDFLKTIHPHPTFSEGWIEALNLANGTPLHFPPVKK